MSRRRRLEGSYTSYESLSVVSTKNKNWGGLGLVVPAPTVWHLVRRDQVNLML